MTDRPDAFLRLPEVLKRTGLSRPTIYRKMHRGEFPKAIQLGLNSVAWRESEVLSWMHEPMTWHVAA